VPEGTGIGVLGPGWVACGVAGRLAGTGRVAGCAVRWSLLLVPVPGHRHHERSLGRQGHDKAS
jgi:hypothetical protein